MVAPDDHVKETEKVLQFVRQVLDGEDHGRRLAKEMRLGFGSVNGVFKNFHHDAWTLYVIARELDVPQHEILPAVTNHGRLPYEDILSASDVIWRFLYKLPENDRKVVEQRARGMSWRDIMKANPGRIYISLMDDYRRALSRLAELGEARFLLQYAPKEFRVRRKRRKRMGDKATRNVTPSGAKAVRHEQKMKEKHLKRDKRKRERKRKGKKQ